MSQNNKSNNNRDSFLFNQNDLPSINNYHYIDNVDNDIDKSQVGSINDNDSFSFSSDYSGSSGFVRNRRKSTLSALEAHQLQMQQELFQLQQQFRQPPAVPQSALAASSSSSSSASHHHHHHHHHQQRLPSSPTTIVTPHHAPSPFEVSQNYTFPPQQPPLPPPTTPAQQQQQQQPGTSPNQRPRSRSLATLPGFTQLLRRLSSDRTHHVLYPPTLNNLVGGLQKPPPIPTASHGKGHLVEDVIAEEPSSPSSSSQTQSQTHAHTQQQKRKPLHTSRSLATLPGMRRFLWGDSAEEQDQHQQEQDDWEEPPLSPEEVEMARQERSLHISRSFATLAGAGVMFMPTMPEPLPFITSQQHQQNQQTISKNSMQSYTGAVVGSVAGSAVIGDDYLYYNSNNNNGASGDGFVGDSSQFNDAATTRTTRTKPISVYTADDGHPQIKGATFVLLLFSLVLAVFLAALDKTIVAVALNAISQEFNSLSQITWIGTAYFLTSTAFIPSYGQLADLFGRKSVFLVAIFLFELGSAMCGASTNMNMMILGRAISGLGGGGIFSLVIIIISELVPMRDRGKYNGIIGATYGLASVAGPLLGGAFVDHLSWRWVFYINIPLGVITVLAVLFILRLPPKVQTESAFTLLKRIDWLGTGLLVGSVVCLLTAIQNGGTQFAWNSPTSIALFSAGGALIIPFIWVEARAENPLIPFSLFKSSEVVGAFASSFFMGCASFALIFYCPFWFQVVANVSATLAGIHTIPLIMGVVIFSMLSGYIASKTGHVYIFIPIGALVCALGATLIATMDEKSQPWQQILYFFIAGAGVGGVIQTNVLVGQFSVPPSLLAVVTANLNFWQSIGGVIGISICSSTFNNKLPSYIHSNLVTANITHLSFTKPNYFIDLLYASPLFIHQILPESEQGPVIHGYVQALSLLFVLTAQFSGICFLVSLFMKKSRLPMASGGRRVKPQMVKKQKQQQQTKVMMKSMMLPTHSGDV